MIPKATIIVPSTGRTERLRKCIESLVAQKTVFAFEILVIIDGPDSEDVKNLIASEYGSRASLSFDTSPTRRGSPRAKNVGARHAKGEILVFVDDDVAVRQDWLAQIVGGYSVGTVGVGGSEVKGPRSEFVRWVWFLLNGNATGKVTRSGLVVSNFTSEKPAPEQVDCLAGANMSFDRAAFEKLGGFDENYLGTAYREETDLCMRMLSLGRLLFTPSAVVDHFEESLGGNSPLSLRDWNYWYHRNNTYFFLKNVGGAESLYGLRHRIVESLIAFCRVFQQRSLYPLTTMSEGVRDGTKAFVTRREHTTI
jgi:GT2 family glycosyltransferase